MQQKVLVALFKTRFGHGNNIGDVEVLGEVSEAAGFLSAEQVGHPLLSFEQAC
jgi:predicted DsbA family dithiol-disulfide isomerase